MNKKLISYIYYLVFLLFTNYIIFDFVKIKSLKIENFIDENSAPLSNSDHDITNKIKKLIRGEFKSIFLKRPTISIHINRV